MLDIVRAPVARTIDVDLRDDDGPIAEVIPAPLGIRTASFVTQLFPGNRIEHLGRPEMWRLGFGGPGPSSLFFQTVHAAYAGHHALGLRPDVLMYLITSVVAETVRRHPNDYRELFTTQAAKARIEIRHDALEPGNSDSPWDEAIELFDQALRPHVPTRIMSQLLPELTTAGREAQLASLIAFMDAASPYYDYSCMTLCGIPRIVLFGDVADYRRLVAAATELAELFRRHLARYFEHLLPVLQAICRTAETGQVDADFWSRIYKHSHGSGSDHFSGWTSAFLWYVHHKDWSARTSPLVEKGEDKADWRRLERYHGLESGHEPTHVSSVPFTWHYRRKELPMRFIGGILGIEVAEQALTPVLSYGVLRR
jgi:hypothetical protein